jgi:hypothetical protein
MLLIIKDRLWQPTMSMKMTKIFEVPDYLFDNKRLSLWFLEF